MPSWVYSLVIYASATLMVVGAVVVVTRNISQGTSHLAQPSAAAQQAAASAAPANGPMGLITVSPATTTATSSASTIATSTKPSKTAKPKTPAAIAPPTTPSSKTASNTLPEAQSAYTTPPESFDQVNTQTRAALVNILCLPRDGGSISPISGSGVIIDPRGVILTNAHVAQFVLLSESTAVNLSCTIRIGSPAKSQWTAEVLYIPSVWVAQHASEINQEDAMGTGEHDYAILLINDSTDGSQRPAAFPYIPFDTRENAVSLNDQVLGAGYPAELVGGIATENNLYAVSSISPIDQLLTFATNTVDVVSIGGVIEAQSGSSGGAVVNTWGRLIGLIATTSAAPQTGARQLHAITLSYINRDIAAQTGLNLTQYLSGDLSALGDTFTQNTAPSLLSQYMQVLAKQ